MFNTIYGLFCFSSKVGKANPYEHGASDVVTLDTRFSTLVLLDAGELFDFPVKLLDFTQRWLGVAIDYFTLTAEYVFAKNRYIADGAVKCRFDISMTG